MVVVQQAIVYHLKGDARLDQGLVDTQNGRLHPLARLKSPVH